MTTTAGYIAAQGRPTASLADTLGCDPSWEPWVVAVMERDHPGLLRAALRTAISEKAVHDPVRGD